jgi:tRNA(Ile)-lysidine synthetase-like protein
MINRLNTHLRKTGLLPDGASIIVAVSGGVDSVALLDLLTELQAKYGWDIAVAHLDHKVRPTSADDAQLVADLARKYDHKYYLGQLGGGETREAALRRARYDYLESIRAGHGADWIVTAHHRDDRLETSVFNTIRGADRYGMTAMRSKRGHVVRPLLPFRKGDLIAYAHTHDLAFVEDETNQDQGYSRNFVRHSLLPLASTMNPNFQSDYLASLDRLEALNGVIESGIEGLLRYLDAGSEGDTLRLNRLGFGKLAPEVQLNVLVHIGRKLCPGIGFSNANLAEAQHYLVHAKTGTSKLIGSVLELKRSYDRLVFSPVKEATEQAKDPGAMMPLSAGAHEYGRFLLSVNPQPAEQTYAKARLKPGRYYVRNRLKGDRIYPVGLSGSKKLSDVFIDSKVSRDQRDSWPVVVTAQNEVVWLPGLAVDRRHTVDETQAHYYVTCEVL